MVLVLTLFTAGMLTILLPCILPLIPIVLGVSVAGRSPWRPLLTVLGMVVSFVGFTFLLQLVLRFNPIAADYLRTATYYVLLLFGIGFCIHGRYVPIATTILGSLFFIDYGWQAVAIAAVCGVIAFSIGAPLASRIQQWGGNLQGNVRTELGDDNPLTAFFMGLTMGLVWVPCAGPALGFALSLVANEPGLLALMYLTTYGLGTATPLLLIGYGGQAATRVARGLNRYSGDVKRISGYLFIVTALALQFHWFRTIETWLVSETTIGNIGVELEMRLFGEGS